MLKEHEPSSSSSPNPPIPIRDHDDPDQKIGFSDSGRDFFPKSDLGYAGFSLKPHKTESTSHKTAHPSSQELTLSYLCENPKMDFPEKEISGKNLLYSLEKGASYKGKEVAWDSVVDGEDRFVERDFLQLNENKGLKRPILTADDEIELETKEKKAKMESLKLSLALPDVSLSLASSNPNPDQTIKNDQTMKTDPAIKNDQKIKTDRAIMNDDRAIKPDQLIKATRSTQSLAPSNNNSRMTCSDDFAPSISYSYSHPFSHNPSCSLTRNSTENYEYSVGSRRRESDQIWYCGEGTNGSVHSRFKPIGDAVNFSNNSGYPVGRPANNSLYPTNSSENLSFFPSELPARQRKDTQSVDSRGRGSEKWKIGENGFTSSDGGRGPPFSRPEKILRELVSESVSAVAQILQELPDDLVEAVKDYLRNLVSGTDKKEELMSLQRRLDRRSDLTFETLSKCHRSHLDILVTVKTGLANYVSGKNRLPSNELIEIFLLTRCRNVNCKSLLPVDDCDCKICTRKKGFCSACMCPVCMNFDCASNTCSWVGCDVCSHWCHAVCGMQMHLIKPGPSLKGGSASEMQFHCLGCGHASEMFGFVKDVFMCCAKDWGLETLIKELDCVQKIFQGSIDFRGKELHNKAEETLAKLEKKLISPSEACNSIMHFFKYSISEFSHSGSSSKDLGQSIKPTDVLPLTPLAPTPPKPSYNMKSSSIPTELLRNTLQSITKPLTTDQMIEAELKFGIPKKDDVDSLETIIRIKEAEARMFQTKADDARREAEEFRQLVRVRSDKLEEEYAEKLGKLCLQETEERRRKKLEELKVLENSHCDYYKMKLRMKAEIAGLLQKMEDTKQQWV